MMNASAHDSDRSTRGPGAVAACLVGLALALLVVGLISGTVLRHIIQVIPIVFAAALVRGRAALGASAALPIFLFWISIVSLIWLFLVGLSGVANGRYTPAEIALTVVMAACSITGGIAAVSAARSLSLAKRAAIFALFGVIQVLAMWVSMLRPIANR